MNPLVLALAVVGSLSLGFFGALIGARVGRIYRAKRADRAHRALCRHLFNNRPRSKILVVGIITPVGVAPNGDQIVLVDGWTFDCLGTVPHQSFLFDGERDRFLIAGWTREELFEIRARPEEFVE